MIRVLAALSLIALARCAQSPESIVPAYVSEVPYLGWSCDQLATESIRLNEALAMASAQQNNARTNDAVGVLLVGLPVSSMTGGNMAPQIGMYKGEQDAVRRASITKKCGAPAG